MLTTRQAIEAGFTFEPTDGGEGYWSFRFGDGYELCIEPLVFGEMYVALYQNQSVLTEKVPFKPSGEGLPPGPVSAVIQAMTDED